MAIGNWPWGKIAAGLSAPRQGNDFFSAFQAGLGGVVNAQMIEEARRRREMDDELRRQFQEREFGLAESRLGLDRQRVDYERRRLEAEERQANAPEDYGVISGDIQGPLLPGTIRAPQGLPKGGYKTYAESLGRSLGAPQNDSMSELEFFRSDPEGFAKYRAAGRAKTEDSPKLADLNTLSDNFRQDPNVQSFITVRDNFKRIESQLNLGSGFGDLSAIFSFMRVLDPTSVVRETEFKNAEEAAGWLQRALNTRERVVHGNRLTPEGRAALLRAARDIYDTQKRTYDSKKSLYSTQGKAYGVDPKLFIPDYGDESPIIAPLSVEELGAKYGF